ncbi:MAG: hypothetical protein ACREX0_19695, partial [Noviherbaspirillum sp.]
DKASFDEQHRVRIRNGAPCDDKEPLRKTVGETKAETAKRKSLQQSESDKELLDGLRTLTPHLAVTTSIVSGNKK